MIVEIMDGILVEIQGPLQQQTYWKKHLFYEHAMLDYIRETYHGGTFIDCGACIGNHTLYFAQYCAEHVIAIEPQLRNMEHMKTNVRLSGLQDKVTFVQVALGREFGRGAMKHVGGFHGQYDLVEGNEVDIVTLDSLLPLIEKPVTLIKLDIQWSEIPALEGGMTMLDKYNPVLFVELVGKGDYKKGVRFMRSIGYKVGPRFNGAGAATYEFAR